MKPLRRSASIAVTVIVNGLPLAGCAEKGSPSLIFFGAYFPSWILCAAFGVLAGAGTRFVMVATGLARVVPYQLFVCASAGLIAAIAVWLLVFGR